MVPNLDKGSVQSKPKQDDMPDRNTYIPQRVVLVEEELNLSVFSLLPPHTMSTQD
jgi:hypothetical protein